MNFVSTNIYGEFAKFDEEKSNVVASLIKKFHDAKIKKINEVIVWGSGNAIRELIYVKDLVNLLILGMERINKKDTFQGLLNCGLGLEVKIKELAEVIKEVTNFNGKIIFDTNKPEGIKKRTINSERFKEKIGKIERITPLKNGISNTYKYFLSLEDGN